MENSNLNWEFLCKMCLHKGLNQEKIVKLSFEMANYKYLLTKFEYWIKQAVAELGQA